MRVTTSSYPLRVLSTTHVKRAVVFDADTAVCRTCEGKWPPPRTLKVLSCTSCEA